MFDRLIRLIVAAGLSLLLSVPAWSQAALLPNAKQTFVDQNGKPLTGGKVYNYVPNTTVFKTTWQDSGQTTSNTNPVTLDAAGRAVIYGQGSYQQRVTDALGNLVWNAPTTAWNSAAPSGATGTDTAPVGTVMPFSGFVVPTNWALSYGQAVSRTTYSELLTAITISDTTVSCTATSPSLSGWADTSQMRVGAPVEGSCIPTGTTVVSITNGTTIVVNNNAVSTVVVPVTVFPWGNGDGVSTFNVPDLRGRAFAGADAMGGTAASRLTTTYYGAGAGQPGVAGGSQSHTLTQAELSIALGTATSIVTDPQHQHGIGQGGAGGAVGFGGGSFFVGSSNGVTALTATGITVATTITNAGGGNAHAIVQPTLTVNYIIKVKPNTTGAGGVVSIGGMFGDVLCGSNVVCTGQTISFSGPGAVVGPLTSTTNNLVSFADTSGQILKDSGVSMPLSLANGGLGASQAAAVASSIPIFPGSGGAAVPTLSPTLLGNWTFNPTSGNALTINTATGTTAMGFNITHSGTTSAPGATFYYDRAQINNDGLDTTGNSTFGLYTGLNTGGATAKGQKIAIQGIVNNAYGSSNTNGDLIGVSGWAISNQSNGGTNTGAGAKGTLYALEAIANAFSGATNYSVVSGLEADAIINTGASAAHRWGISISANSDLQGAQTDAAIETHDVQASGRFTNFILLRQTPITTGGIIIGSDSTIVTATHFASLPTYTFSGNIFDFGTPFKVTGAGVMTVPSVFVGNGVATTSMTSPLSIGGSGTTGIQKTFKTTTGNGTTDAFAFVGGNNGGTTFATLAAAGLTLSMSSPLLTTAGTELVMSQTGDAAGATSITLRNRTGLSGALFTNVAGDWVDFGFVGSGAVQNNFRMEHRSAQFKVAENTGGEFQFITSGGVFWAAIGGATTIIIPTTASTSKTTGSIINSGGFGNSGAIWTDTLVYTTGISANGSAGITRTCTIAVGNVLTFTLGILTATSGAAGCV